LTPWHGLCFHGLREPDSVLPEHNNHFLRGEIVMGNRAIWAILWVIGIPLPILLVLYFLTGGGCN
jgi:hypothetical protein